jgi:hypothetical protein
MPVERRAEEPKNGAREGTGDRAQEANSNQGRDNNGRQPVGAKGRRGAAAGSPMRRDDAGNPRTLRRKAMYERLMEQAVADENYAQALAAVKRNQGSAGIDRMTTEQLGSHLKANWWIRRGHRFCRYADDCNIYVGSQSAAERTLTSIQVWIEKHLRLKVNAAKSGTGRVWERKFLGFRVDREKRIGIAPESLERFKTKVREMWNGGRSRTSNQLRDEWSRYVRGWCSYFRLAEVRRPIRALEPWIRRHIRKCFWLRWHDRRGRLRRLRNLGLSGRALGLASSKRGAWGVAKQPELHCALSNATLRRYGFLLPSDLAVN